MLKWMIPIVCAAIVMHILSVLWHGGVMAGFYQMFSTNPNEPIHWISFLGYLFLAGLMAFIQPRLSKGSEHVLVSGLKLGVLVGFVWVSPHGLTLAGTKGAPLFFFGVESAWHLVEQGIGGCVFSDVRSKLLTGERGHS